MNEKRCTCTISDPPKVTSKSLPRDLVETIDKRINWQLQGWAFSLLEDGKRRRGPAGQGDELMTLLRAVYYQGVEDGIQIGLVRPEELMKTTGDV